MIRARVYRCDCDGAGTNVCTTPWIVDTASRPFDAEFATYEEARQYVAGLIDKEES